MKDGVIPPLLREPEGERNFLQFDNGKAGLDELKGGVNNQLKMSVFDRELLIARLRSDPQLSSKRCFGADLVLCDFAELAVNMGTAVSSSVTMPLAGYIDSEESFF